MKRLLIKFLLLAVFAAGIESAQFVPLSIEDMARQAELIVRGRVLEKTYNRDAEGRIYTSIRLEVLETWKGKTPSSPITLVHSGGKYEGRVAAISGQVEYTPGEEVAAFLVLNSRSQAVTLGLAQGKFHLWKDPESGQVLARNLFHGNGKPKSPGSLPLSPLSTAGTAQNTADSTETLPVSVLKQKVLGGVQ
jgi:hypothetical protein